MGKILVLDDDVDLVMMIERILFKAGHEVIPSYTCEEGLEKFYTTNPDLVLLDINVGNSDGREVCRKIRENATYDNIPVVMISANTELLQTFSGFGADSYLTKPFSNSQMIEMLDMHLGSATAM